VVIATAWGRTIFTSGSIGVVHADLECGALGVGRHARQRQRHADVVVVGFHR
jgi:hypothetical protein